MGLLGFLDLCVELKIPVKDWSHLRCEGKKCLKPSFVSLKSRPSHWEKQHGGVENQKRFLIRFRELTRHVTARNRREGHMALFYRLLKKVIQRGRRERGPRGVLFVYVEGFGRPRTKLGAFFSSLLVAVHRRASAHRISITI